MVSLGLADTSLTPLVGSTESPKVPISKQKVNPGYHSLGGDDEAIPSAAKVEQGSQNVITNGASGGEGMFIWDLYLWVLVKGAWSKQFSKQSSNICLNDNHSKDVNFEFHLNWPNRWMYGVISSTQGKYATLDIYGMWHLVATVASATMARGEWAGLCTLWQIKVKWRPR